MKKLISKPTDISVVTNGDRTPLAIASFPNFKRDLQVSAGVFWNKYQVDKRGGIIGWCDGDHGEYGGDTNSVRYFNLGAQPFHGISPGEVGYLIPPITTANGAKVSEYDNYHWWYFSSVDKFFWIHHTNMNMGSREGIFDMKSKDWSHGNSDVNAAQWPNGPYWTDYVKPSLSYSLTITKNSPNGYSELLDKAVAIFLNFLFIIEPNPNYPASEPQPYRISIVNIKDRPFQISLSSHNQFMNSGVCVGEWFYFIRPAGDSERGAYPDHKMREFWRLKLVAPYDQFEKLAYFPRFDINPVQNVAEGASTNGSWGPLLVYDEISNSIFALYDRLYVYHIDSNVWVDQTPTPWQRVLYAVGGMIKSTREIVYRGGNNVDLPKGHPDRQSWSKLKISGGIKPL